MLPETLHELNQIRLELQDVIDDLERTSKRLQENNNEVILMLSKNKLELNSLLYDINGRINE